MTIRPYWQHERATLYGGDALAVLAELPAASVDAVITDPPYSSGGAFRGDRNVATTEKYRGWSQNPDGSSRKPDAQYEGFTGDTRDQRGYLMWCSLWLAECLRVSRPGSSLLMFTDWRQLPVTTDAIQSGGWVWRGVAVWDKGIGRPMRGRFRNHVEFVVWGTNGPTGDPEDIYLSSVFRHAPPRPDDREHLTQKPVRLLREFMPLVPKDGTVLDPFMGSGTTGCAAIAEGRFFVGAELTPHYQQVARERIEASLVGYRDDGRQLPPHGRRVVTIWPWNTITSQLKLISAKLDVIETQQEKLLSEQSQVDQDVQAVEADVSAIAAAVTAIQAEITALQSANPGVDLTGLNQAVTDLANATTAVEGLEPPAPPAT